MRALARKLCVYLSVCLSVFSLTACEKPEVQQVGTKRQGVYPPHEDDIFSTGIAEIPLPVDPDFQWIVVPESAFETALEAIPPGERNGLPESLQYLEGASSISNDPWTAGVIANNTYPADLAGRYWIVAKDPGMAGGEGSEGEGIIITQDYRLAIIDLNIPKSVWFGAGGRAVRRPNANLAMGRCVGEEKIGSLGLRVGEAAPRVGG
jgi:hypothetical protein